MRSVAGAVRPQASIHHRRCADSGACPRANRRRNRSNRDVSREPLSSVQARRASRKKGRGGVGDCVRTEVRNQTSEVNNLEVKVNQLPGGGGWEVDESTDF